MKLERIIYVEDDTDIQDVVMLALKLAGGFTVKLFSSGQEAIDGAVKFSPDMILLDVMMPGLDGPTTMHKLREQTQLSDVPVVFLTAKVQSAEVSYYKSLGAIDVISKPFDPMALAGKLSIIWKKHNE